MTYLNIYMNDGRHVQVTNSEYMWTIESNYVKIMTLDGKETNYFPFTSVAYLDEVIKDD